MTRRLPPARASLVAAIVLALAALPAAARPQAVETPAEEPYVDRVIDPDALQPLPEDEELVFDPAGLPRSLSLEWLLSRTERGEESFNERGMSMSGFWETERWGSLSLDATVFNSDRERFGDSPWAGTATLWQRGLYLDGGWRGDNGLGVLNSPMPPILREQYRFFLPSVPLLGASTDWTQAGRNLRLQASAGRAGVFEGARVVGFDLADGQVASLGAQWQWAKGWTGALGWLSTDGRIVPDDTGEAFFQDGRTRSLVLGTTWKGKDDSLGLYLQDSSGYLGDATGAWVDARSERGRYTHHYGLFRLEPDLAWGALPINNDAQGGYYRIGYQHARWVWNAGIDAIRSVSGDSFEGLYGNVFARYQASTLLGYGGSLSVRDSDSETVLSARAFADRRSTWGLTRAQVDVVGSGGAADSWQLSLDQALPMKQGSRLSLSAAYGSLSYDGAAATDTLSVSAFGGIDLTDRLTIDGSARWTRGDGPDAFRGTDLNLSVNWRLAPRWWLIGTLYENRGSRRSPFVIDPLADPNAYQPIPRDRSLFLSLRYERQAGTPMAVLGGPPGGAVGSIGGSIYLDENGDGERSASELPAANVTVVLDGRYSVRTDSQGRFEFPRVAAGPHVLGVIPDNLPLPWFFTGEDERRNIEVRVREQQRVDIGARRDR